MSHWYTKEGERRYTIVGANGKERDTTLADARKLGLVPSVTTITKGVLAAPALTRWMINGNLETAYNNPPFASETAAEWGKRVQSLFAEQNKAADFGTLIHNLIERSINGEDCGNIEVTNPAGVTYRASEFINPVLEVIEDNGWEVRETEKVVVGDGYAGSADAVYFGRGEYGILDFKTTGDATKPFIPPTYAPQIALYHAAECGGIDDCAAGYNIFISSERNIGAVKVVRYDSERLRSEYEFGMMLVKCWQHINNYRP